MSLTDSWPEGSLQPKRRSVGNITLSTTPALITRQRQNLGRIRTYGCEVKSRVELRKDLNLALHYQFTAAAVVECQRTLCLSGCKRPRPDQVRIEPRLARR
jgi:hypothetical protein